jgi:Family of unknown function (DUF6508)
MTKEGLQHLASFLQEPERSGFKAGEWRGGKEIEPNVISMPFVDYNDIVNSFIQAADRHGWIVSDFDWGEWPQSVEAARLHDDESALAHATAEQLGRLLTLHIRQDRFVEGALLEAFESGLMLRIVRRAAVLAVASHTPPEG